MDSRIRPNPADLKRAISEVKTGERRPLPSALAGHRIEQIESTEIEGLRINLYLVESGRNNDPECPATYYDVWIIYYVEGSEICRKLKLCGKSLEPAKKVLYDLVENPARLAGKINA